MTQHLEKHIKKILNGIPNSYNMKIQVNSFAHKKTPADFLLLTDKHNYMIECKECAGTSFPFRRLTQKEDLVKFSLAMKRNIGAIVLCFWHGRINKSSFYVLNIFQFLKLMNSVNKKSVNMEDLNEYYISYIDLRRGEWLQ